MRLTSWLRCLVGLHYYGAPANIYRGQDGYAYWSCMHCFKAQRLSAAWAIPETAPAADTATEDPSIATALDEIERASRAARHAGVRARAIARAARAREEAGTAR